MMHAPLRVGDRYHGFRVLRLQSLPEPKAVAVDCLHERTGLRLFHFFNQDPNSLFAFAFPSYPENDCGLPHIVEHCVLSGSEKYPLKDAFNAFSKGSVNTYMNALTYADKTLFPASSMVEADYFHLFSLYADSLFHPLLSREIFEQEGIRIEADAEGNPLPKGVVYNEMLGDYSDSDSLMFNAAFRTLLSGTPYAFDSGGNPESIVTLTYEAFLDFYRKHYEIGRAHV